MLFQATLDGDAGIIKPLIDNGAFPHHKNAVGNTALHRACFYRYDTCIQPLMDNGHQTDISRTDYINAKNKFGNTALHYASFNGHVDCILPLIENGANLHQTNKANQTALHIAKVHRDDRYYSKKREKFDSIIEILLDAM